MFEPGDRVMCVSSRRARTRRNNLHPVVQGEIYTVAWFGPARNDDTQEIEPAVELVEMGEDPEWAYRAEAFSRLGRSDLIANLLAQAYRDERDIKRKPVAA